MPEALKHIHNDKSSIDQFSARKSTKVKAPVVDHLRSFGADHEQI